MSFILVVLWSFSCSTETSEKDSTLLYLEEILGKAPKESNRYVLVSDYGCSACKERIYQEVQSSSSQTIYIILLPRNKAVLNERFQTAIQENRVLIDAKRLSLEFGVLVAQALELKYLEGEWNIQNIE